MSSNTAGPSRPGGYVSLQPDWKDQTAFVICGGLSVKQANLESLRGRRVAAVNRSFRNVPWADILFYGDERFELEHRAEIKAFKGRVLSSTYGSQHCSYVEFLRRPRPSDCPAGLSSDTSEAWMRHTSVRGLINALCHLGVAKIVTVGLDGDGAHHHEPYPWGQNSENWARQREELSHVAPALKARGIELLNASPGSKIPFWPIVNLKDVIR